MPAARSAGSWSMTASKTGRGVRKAATPGTSRSASGSGSSRCGWRAATAAATSGSQRSMTGLSSSMRYTLRQLPRVTE
eukprot:2357822-Prymnesium_polylepis.1